jgi:histidinol-phosphatase (PHP family)
MIDYHMHGNFCGHACGDLEEYVQSAIEKGLREIGFSAHLPKIVDPDPYHAMLIERLPEYVDLVQSLSAKYSGSIRIKLGIEADYFTGHEKETAALLDSWPFDYVLGSLHFLGDWHFTSKAGQDRYETADPSVVFPEYFRLLREMVGTGLFDILAHPDAIRKESFRPVSALTQEYDSVASLLAARGMAIEVNTGGLRRNAGSIYPEKGFLEACTRMGVPVTLGSDAHNPSDVARDFDAAFDLLDQTGVTEVAVWDKRVMTRRPLSEFMPAGR